MIWEIDQPESTLDGVDAAGRPDPAYSAALGLLPAPYGRRVLAFVVDIAIWTLLQLPLWLGAVPLLLKLATGSISPYGFVNHPDFVFAVVMAAVSVALMLAFALVQWILHGRRGVTIGKAMTGIRSVNVRTLERPRAGAVLLRFLLVGAAGLLPAVGTIVILVSPTFDPQRRGRGLHDRATGVWLVDIRRGLNPYDEKRMRIARKSVKAEPLPERAQRPSLATPSDPTSHVDYRPGNRISAGVLGVGRAPDAAPAAADAAPAAAPAAPAPGVIDGAPDFAAAAPAAAAPASPAPASLATPALRDVAAPTLRDVAAPAPER
ncbi:RDD family protein, partial [Microbacterium sp. 179-B 1A2 NHS]|uniref:RDD family protein n=1 Tax=Microbacterium sp. 179-B 1A2 NHS TaxID=3142383 RepID=UPI0039A2ACCE